MRLLSYLDTSFLLSLNQMAYIYTYSNSAYNTGMKV